MDSNQTKKVFDCLQPYEEPYKCKDKDCTFKSFNKVTLIKHIVALQEPAPQKCGKCDFKTSSIFAFFMHRNCMQIGKTKKKPISTRKKAVLKSAETSPRRSGPHVQSLSCSECSYVANFKSCLRRHIKLRHKAANEVKWHECTVCSFKSRLYHNLKMHILRIHNQDELLWHECDQCVYKSKIKSCLKRHRSLMHNSQEIKFYSCGQCQKQFSQPANLRAHELIHSQEKSMCVLIVATDVIRHII